ncbi:hypothetical protein [Neisseria shayeganii]|uniref:Uncharacterized protein n=1 Tax=Neisseria shayeganii 871 TaxID=1032488 RepID=G4CG64_9NEIS|nr:hypothetical protein [Neisseria shayeganii]EGY53112.1 hypothetical protein HMPREF9371_0603 [Neisseria shayeganii 871]
MDTVRERRHFEKWAREQGYCLLKHSDNSYQSAETEDAWFVWCARAELEQ